ncbi:MAG: histidine kinase [Usitatibacteraceae bacterium]
MIGSFRSRFLLWVPGLALAAGSVALVLEGPSSDRLLNASLAGVGVVLVWSVAVAVRLRYPERPLSLLLFLLAGGHAMQTLAASSDPALYTMARVARPAVEVFLIWVMLAFPTGRLQTRVERAIVIAAALAVVVLWLPGMLLSPGISSIAGASVTCLPDCPRNVLFIADFPQASALLHGAFRFVGAFILLATAAVLFNRLRQATPLMRRTLTPVLFASIARALAMAAFLLTGSFALALLFAFWLIPMAIALGLLRGRLYVARSLQKLVTGLRARPGVHELRNVMANALDDTSLSIAYWLQDSARWVDAEGKEVALPYPTAERGRAVTMVRDSAGRPVAALVHDAALLDEPTLVDAVASSMQVALESHRMEAELNASRASTATAVEEERHRIERDLHDGAQQRLIALRMKISVTSRLLQHDARRAAEMLTELGADAEAALNEVRALAHGVVPPLLVERGLADALCEAAQRAAIPTRTDIGDVGRLDAAVEGAVYYCCLEALQNAAKHAGDGAEAQLALRSEGDTLYFHVVDTGTSAGVGPYDPHGQGLSNMRARIEGIGGKIAIAREQQGFRVTGSVSIYSTQAKF